MRRAVFLCLLLCTGVAPAAIGASGLRHNPGARCLPPRALSRVLVADAQAQVYLSPARPSGELEIFACAYGRSHRYLLGPPPRFSSSGGGGIEHATLSGSTLAYQDSTVGPEEGRWLLVVRDLRTGKLLQRTPTGVHGPSSERLVGAGYAVALVLKQDGAIAWIVRTGAEKCAGSQSDCYEVHTLDKSGSHLLTTGTDIDPASLALVGSTLYWTQGGKPSSSTLN